MPVFEVRKLPVEIKCLNNYLKWKIQPVNGKSKTVTALTACSCSFNCCVLSFDPHWSVFCSIRKKNHEKFLDRVDSVSSWYHYAITLSQAQQTLIKWRTTLCNLIFLNDNREQIYNTVDLTGLLKHSWHGGQDYCVKRYEGTWQLSCLSDDFLLLLCCPYFM